MTVIPLPVDPRTELRLWLCRHGYVTAGVAATRGMFALVLARVPPRDRHRVRQLVEAVRAEEDELQRDPVLQEARALYLLAQARRAWNAEAKQLILETHAAVARCYPDPWLRLVRRPGTANDSTTQERPED
jgi:hypothetical protein